MKSLKIGLGLLIAVGLAGCATSSRITYDYDDSINFAAYETFDWMMPPGDIDDPLGAYPTVALRIKRAVESELEAKGFDKVDEAPDFYVVYHASVERDLTRAYIDTWGYYYPHYRRYPRARRYPPAAWGFVYVDAYEEGTLVIDIVDGATNELAWRGAARGAVGHPDRISEKIDEAVRRILETFPPYGLQEEEVQEGISAAVQ